jgi:hypothetical protein
MAESDDELSKLMRAHLAKELDQYVGRAGERFARAIGPADARPASSGFMRLWWAAPIVAAAAVIAVVIAPALHSVTPQPTVISDPVAILPHVNDPAFSATQAVAFAPKDVTGKVYWETRDEGQVWLDDETPARRIRTQQLQTLQYTDPRDSSRIEITIPREEILLVSSPRI